MNGGYLHYEFHLRLSASYVTRYGHLLDITVEDLQTLYAAIYFHDSIEDARLTYYDELREFEQLNQLHCNIHVETASETVYALTNEKGKNWVEKANEKYYAGIRKTKFASFLKMCDRLANLHYSSIYGIRQRIAEVYQQELPHFIQSIGKVPEEMVIEAQRLAKEGYTRPSENIF